MKCTILLLALAACNDTKPATSQVLYYAAMSDKDSTGCDVSARVSKHNYDNQCDVVIIASSLRSNTLAVKLMSGKDVIRQDLIRSGDGTEFDNLPCDDYNAIATQANDHVCQTDTYVTAK